MRSLVLAVGSIFALAAGGVGCGKGRGDKFDEILKELESFKTQMCACKDAACADKVMDARREYKTMMRDKLDKGAKPDEAQDRRGKALELELHECRRILTGETTSTGSGEHE